MAHIIPSDITELALAGASAPELATLDRLRRDLPGDYVVFHGVHWSREYAGYIFPFGSKSCGDVESPGSGRRTFTNCSKHARVG
jgi:hypothetical protein